MTDGCELFLTKTSPRHPSKLPTHSIRQHKKATHSQLKEPPRQ
ncbi:hypothetical protein HMPREF3226_02860 [Prevotella corporis]|uniref:Uncharacterized protein n=1 Tax=Prevotella corporis TaxID=28128 RepID=A0A133PT22_9BACT|nr:hypothetical protein HMPREF3226_02860 [Prevotella corporis]